MFRFCGSFRDWKASGGDEDDDFELTDEADDFVLMVTCGFVKVMARIEGKFAVSVR